MTQNDAHGTAYESPWWVRALIASTTGFIASLLIGFAWSIGTHFEVEPIRNFETAGADVGAWYRANRWHGDLELGIRYVFVDVDQVACASFRKANRCQAGTPLPPPLIAAFIKGAQASNAAVIVLDVAPFEDSKDRIVIQDAACEMAGGAWIVAPIYGRPAGLNDRDIYGDEDFDLRCAAPLNQHRLRLASFKASTDKDAGDAQVRRFAALHRVHFTKPSTTGDMGYAKDVPSAPYLTSLLSDAALAAQADCIYYRPYDSECTASKPPNTAALALPGEHHGQLNSLINYSLPSLATLDPREGDDESSSHDFINLLASCGHPSGTSKCGYQRLLASGWLGGSHEFAKRPDLDGAIVVLGSSEPAAMDMHLTPAGFMAGAEVIINATRGFGSRAMDRPPLALPPLSLRERSIEKANASLTGAALMTVAWLLIFGAIQYATARGRAVQLATRFLVVPSLFVLGLGCVFHLEFLHETAKYRQAFLFAARPVDLVSPLLLLGLEGYAEAMNFFMAKTEKTLHKIFDAASHVIGRVISRKTRGNANERD